MSMTNGMLAIPGMVSGLPTQQIIQQLVAAQQAEETPLKNQQTAINNQIQAWNSLSPLFTNFQTSLQTLVNPSTWSTYTTTSSNSSAITATASTSAVAGTYTIQSDQLAQAQSMLSANLSPTNVGTAGSFQIAQNGKTTTVNVNAGDSLSTIASAINTASQAAGMKVVAAVITNSSGTANLMLSSSQTGVANKFTLTDVTGNNVSNFGLVQKNAAQDAQAEINGVTVTSSTNTFTNVVGGLSFTLNQATVAGNPAVTSTITVAQDTTAITNAVNGFMKSYNSLLSTLKSISQINAVDSSGATPSAPNGPLAGDVTVQQMLMGLETSVGNMVSGAGTLQGLGSVGIILHADGTLAYDTTSSLDGGDAHGLDGQAMFNNVLTTDQADMKNLFGVVSVDGLSPTTGVGGFVNSFINSATFPNTGTIASQVSSLNDQNSILSNQISQIDDASALYQSNLEAQFNAMEMQISQLKSQQQWLNQFGGSPSSSSSSSSSSSGA